jgi:cell division transport system ATP-binding protein
MSEKDLNEHLVSLNKVKVAKDDITILGDVNFNLESGEFVYLIGKTGSGKSSLLKLLYGDIKLKTGDGIVCGYNLKTLKRKEIPYLRRKLGIVFQDFELLTDRTVYQNLLFVLKATGWKDKSRMESRISEVLEQVGLSTKGYKLPHELSGGEQQRVVISRALLNDPVLILADEPTGNLDPETSKSILRLLHNISKQGTSVIMATHDYSAMEHFPSRIVACRNQRLVEA